MLRSQWEVYIIFYSTRSERSPWGKERLEEIEVTDICKKQYFLNMTESLHTGAHSVCDCMYKAHRDQANQNLSTDRSGTQQDLLLIELTIDDWWPLGEEESQKKKSGIKIKLPSWERELKERKQLSTHKTIGPGQVYPLAWPPQVLFISRTTQKGIIASVCTDSFSCSTACNRLSTQCCLTTL